MSPNLFRVFSFSFLCLGAAHVAAQEQWLQLTSPVTTNLLSVQFPDSVTGYIVGDSGKIYKTTDAAGSWTPQISGVVQSLKSVKFTSPVNGVVVGLEGVILRTTNGGASWVVRPSGTTRNLNALAFPSSTIGYAVGDTGLILKTTDGGATWAAQTSGTTKDLNAIHMLGTGLGYIVGVGLLNENGSPATFLKTTNGTSWSALTGPAFSTAYAVYALDTNTLFATNYDINIQRSTNGGATWQGGSIPDVSSGYSSLYFSNSTTGYALFAGSNILKTTNAGASWFTQATPTGASFRGIDFSSLNTGYVVCGNGKIFKHVFTPPATPSLTTPAQNALNLSTSLSLAWGAVSFTTTYRAQVSTDSLFGSTFLNDSTLLSPTAFVENLNFNTTYYWRVSATNPGGTGAWSVVRKFTTMLPPIPSVPVLSSPAADTMGVPAPSVILAWQASAGAATYRVQLSADSTFATASVNDSTVSVTSRSVGPLTLGAKYYWRVNAKNAGGTSAYSSIRRFTVTNVIAVVPAMEVKTAGVGDGAVLQFYLPAAARVQARLYNAGGALVSTLMDEKKAAGFYTIRFPDEKGGGLYFLDFRAGEYRQLLKIVR